MKHSINVTAKVNAELGELLKDHDGNIIPITQADSFKLYMEQNPKWIEDIAFVKIVANYLAGKLFDPVD